MDVPAIHPLIGNKYDANSGGQSYIEALQAAAEVIKLKSDSAV